MARTRLILGVCLMSLVVGIKPTHGENYPLIIKGKVTMPDGSPPPITVAIERICSDQSGDRPGPLTNKQGEYLWNMEVDPMRTRACYLRATHAGYISSSIDISALDGYLSRTVTLDPIIISAQAADPYAIRSTSDEVPSRASASWKAALNALDAKNYPEAKRQFEASVQAAPKFALGWHALGVILDYQNMQKEAREAFENAVKLDPKLLRAYVTLVRLCIKTKDWESAVKTADALIKADKKRIWPEVHLHRAVALYGLKDLEGAAESVREAIRLDSRFENPRAEYVLGRILEAKGDLDGARQHMSKYLDVDKKAPDAERIQNHLHNLGDPKALQTEGAEPELEYL
jgi:tetratricopeptide (TPR) repeat protein